MSVARQYLEGKILRFEFAGWDKPIFLIFNENKINVFNDWDAQANCIVYTDFFILLALVKYQSLVQLIKHGDLNIVGDSQLIQQFAILLDMTEFDLVELLALCIGDIAAEDINHRVTIYLIGILQLVRIGRAQLIQAINDEWRLIPSSLELEWFFNEVDVIADTGDRLATRLEKLFRSST